MTNLVQKINQYSVVFISLLSLSLLSGVIAFIATVNGPWGYSDSVEYIVTARNLIRGIGFGIFNPSGKFVITYLHPPLYPLLLSGLGVWGIDLVDAARWCNIILGVATVFLTGFVFLRFSRYPVTAILASILTVFFPTTLEMFTSSMSEVLFLFLLVFSCFLLLQYFQKSTTRSLLIAAFFCGLMPITRYVGVAIIFSAVVCVFLFSAGSWQERAKKSFLYGLSASIPVLIWFTVLYFGPSSALGGRNIQINGEQLVAGFYFYREAVTEILWNWIPFSRRSPFEILYQIRHIFLIVTFLVVSVITWIAGRHLAKKDRVQKFGLDVQIAAFFGIGVVSYIAFFTVSWLFTYPQPDLIDRLLMPIYFGVTLGLLGCWAVIRNAWLSSANLFAQTIPWLLVFIAIYWYYPQLIDVIIRSYENNTVTAYRWKDSQVIHALEDLPADQLIISSKSEAVLMWADRPAYDLMENLNPDFMKQNSPYGSDDTDAAQRVFRQGAVLVVFNDFPDQFESIYKRRGRERLATIFDGLTIIGQYPDGTIYMYPSK